MKNKQTAEDGKFCFCTLSGLQEIWSTWKYAAESNSSDIILPPIWLFFIDAHSMLETSKNKNLYQIFGENIEHNILIDGRYCLGLITQHRIEN